MARKRITTPAPEHTPPPEGQPPAADVAPPPEVPGAELPGVVQLIRNVGHHLYGCTFTLQQAKALGLPEAALRPLPRLADGVGGDASSGV